MCGRFYVDDDTAREIERVVRKVDEQLRREKHTGDIHPTQQAAVITAGQEGMTAENKRWGFPGFGTRKVIFNARAESVLEKKMFRESVLRRRLIVPASGFYEWNAGKEKVTFTAMNTEQKASSILFLAGFYNRFADGDRFVILTTAANASMKDTHDRMPLILEPQELETWLWEEECLDALLHKEPRQLRKKLDYEQQVLHF